MENKTLKVITFSAAQLFTLLINFFLSPYLSRVLSKSDYAAYNLVIVIIALSGVVFSLGIPSIIFLFFSKKDNDRQSTISTIQFLILFFALFASTFIFTLSHFSVFNFDNPSISTYLGYCSFSIFFNFVHNYFLSLLIFNNKTKLVALITIVTSIFSVIFVYISLNFWHSVLFALLFSQFFTPMLSAILSFPFAIKYVLPDFKPSLNAIKKILKYSIPLYITSLLGSSYQYISAFFVLLVLGNVEYANYRNGAVEIPFISTVAMSISAILLPDISKYFHEGNKMSVFELKKKIINQSIYLLYPVIIFFIVYNYEFIISYFSIKYEESAIVFAIYSFTCFVRINNYQDVLITAEKSTYILKANAFYFIINLVMVLFFGLLFGTKGVAIAASLSVFILAYLLLRKDAEVFQTKVSSFFEVKNIMILVFGSFIVSILIKILLSCFFNNNHLMVFIVAGFVYFPLIYLYILKKGFLVDSLVNIVVTKAPIFRFFLPKK